MIFYKKEQQAFYLESKGVTYAFRVDGDGFLEHLYFGKSIGRDIPLPSDPAWDGTERAPSRSLNEVRLECPLYGRSDFRECMLALDFGGVRVADFRYEGHEIVPVKPTIQGMPSLRGGETLIISLRERVHNTVLKLFYTVFEDLPMLLRHAEITAGDDCKIDRAFSFSLDLPRGDYESITLVGAHMRERRIVRTPLSHGIFKADSKRGMSSAQTNPFLAVVKKNTDEERGDAYGFNLVYSGDFALVTQIEQNGELRVTGGLNDFDFSWELKKGETFATPEAVLVYSDRGLGGMSRAFHDGYRNYLIDQNRVFSARPIVINNWEATYFDFNTEKLCAIIDAARGTGIDTFVLDDGWFGVRRNDRAGLGDWTVNEDVVDLRKVIAHAHEAGMRFGLWFEPEMVNRDSNLYRAHPDWILHAEGMEPCMSRHQYVLDLTRKEVRDHIVEAVSNVLDSYPIDYVKWDMNRPLTENVSPSLGTRGKETHHRYILGLYNLFERVVKTHPNVFFEGCASGGCRFDAGILAYFPQIWTSDNTDAYARTFIQYGTSLCYPLSAMSCHVSAVPNHQCGRSESLRARGDIAHLGATGYELDLTKLSSSERQEISEQVKEYRAMSELIFRGDVYRLSDPESGLFAMEIISKDGKEAVITAMRSIYTVNEGPLRLFPKGLKDGEYEVNGVLMDKKTIEHYGLLPEFPFGDFATVTLKLKKR